MCVFIVVASSLCFAELSLPSLKQKLPLQTSRLSERLFFGKTRWASLYLKLVRIFFCFPSSFPRDFFISFLCRWKNVFPAPGGIPSATIVKATAKLLGMPCFFFLLPSSSFWVLCSISVGKMFFFTTRFDVFLWAGCFWDGWKDICTVWVFPLFFVICDCYFAKTSL